MTKKAYLKHSIIDTISSAIELLCGERGQCTPTNVLELSGLSQCNETRTLVIEVAEVYGYSVKPSGKGFVIDDLIGNVCSGE